MFSFNYYDNVMDRKDGKSIEFKAQGVKGVSKYRDSHPMSCWFDDDENLHVYIHINTYIMCRRVHLIIT